ncbi:MAG TPA: SAF domain-containing protein [Dermatophilaceae bacterium]
MSIATTQESNRSGHHGKGQTVPASEVPVPGGSITPPPRLRRRPALVAASVAAICLGALLAVWAYTGASTSQDVLAVRATVHRGELITRDDLMTAQIGVDPALKPLPASAADTVVGKRAAMDLAAGGLVTAEDVTSAVVPAKGMSLVGVSLPPALMPAAQLQSGDQVRIVATPGAQGDVATGTSPTSIGATVVGVRGVGDSGQIVVDVSVPYDQAAELAARAATGKIALVLDSRER